MKRALSRRSVLAPPASVPPRRSSASRRVSGVLALEPLILFLALAAGLLAALLSLHVFALFGAVPGAELLVLASLGALPRPASPRVLAAAVIAQTSAATASIAAALGLLLPVGLAAAHGSAGLTASLLLGGALFCAVALVSAGWPVVRLDTRVEAEPPAAERDAALASSRPIAGSRLAGFVFGLVASSSQLAMLGPPLFGAFGLGFLGSGPGMAALAAGLILRPTLAYAGTLGLESTYLPHGLLLGAALGGLTQAAALALVCRGRALAARPPRTEQSTAAPAPHPRGPRGRSGSWPGLRRLAAGRWPRLLMLTLTLYTLAGVVTFVGADLGPLELSAPETLGLGLATALLALGLQRFGGLVGSLPGSVPTLGGGVAVLALTGYLRLDVGAALLMVALSMTAAPLSVALHRQLLVAQAVGGARLRGQQVIASLLGLAAALVVIAAGHETYFERGFIPPAAVGLAAGLDLTNQPAALMALLPWLLVGALLQWLGGPRQSVGLLFATGLLIALPEAGWALLAGLGLKALAAVLFRGRAETTMAIFGLGCIAGEMLRTALGG